MEMIVEEGFTVYIAEYPYFFYNPETFNLLKEKWEGDDS